MKRLIVIGAAVLSLTGCGFYNKPVQLQENVEKAKAEMLSAGQKRLDLVDNAVAVVKGYAGHEKGTLTEVTALRSKMGSVNVNASTAEGKEQLEAYIQNQSKMTGALNKLMMVSENYPNLKADQSFLQLQRDLKRADRDMQEARDAYIASITRYNKQIKVFPNNIFAGMFGFEPLPQFHATDEGSVKTAPKVQF